MTIRRMTNIENLKALAIAANKRGDEHDLQLAIDQLEKHWHDHQAAYRFYTMLEKTADDRRFIEEALETEISKANAS